MTHCHGCASVSLQNSAGSPHLSPFIPAGELSGLAFIEAVQKPQVKKLLSCNITGWDSVTWQGYYLLEETDFSFRFDCHSLSLVFSHFMQNEIWRQKRMLKEVLWFRNFKHCVEWMIAMILLSVSVSFLVCLAPRQNHFNICVYILYNLPNSFS